jgi:hypothetical protein
MNEVLSLKKMAEAAGVPVEKVCEVLESWGITILSVHMPASNEDLKKKYMDAIEVAKRGRRIVLPKSYGDTTKEDHGKSSSSSTNHKPIQISYKYSDLLSRKFIIFTEAALRSPGILRIMEDVVRFKTNNKTDSKLVMVRGVLDRIEANDGEEEYNDIIEAAETLEDYNIVVMLDGDAANESDILKRFIDKCVLSDTILVIGANPSLVRVIKIRNGRNRNNAGYQPIVMRDLNNSGSLSSKKPAFPSARDKACTPLTSTPKQLKGAVPITGGFVFRKKDYMEPVRLEKVINDGGAEGIIYQIDEGRKCAKIFKATNFSELKQRKIELMCEKYGELYQSNRAIMDRIAWPEEVLYIAYADRTYEPIGYVMKLIKNTVPFSYFNYRTFSTLIPGVKKSHQVTMAVSFAELIQFVHENNIILCDINRGNILFDQNQQAYLVDLDSAQIADRTYYYPSNVGVPEFLSPEHINDEEFLYRKERRKKADDIWIMQMLLFHMLTPDGDPYATTEQVSEDKDKISGGLYPYQAGENEARKVIGGVGGPWHIIVGHFPKSVKFAFWNAFHHDGKNFKEQDRKDAGFWLGILLRYQEHLPQREKEDAESGLYEPKNPRKYTTNKTGRSVSGAKRRQKDNISVGSLKSLIEQVNKLKGNHTGTISWKDSAK